MPPKKSLPVAKKLPFLIIELAGFCLSFYLFAISSGLLHKQLPCARNKFIACENIVKGQFSHIGPISIAAMGVIYFVIHLMLTAGLKDRTAQVLKVLIVLTGVIFVAWLRSLELIYIKKICLWCWSVAGLTLVHAGFAWYLASPPLKRMKPLPLAGTVFGGFIVIFGLVSVLEFGLGFGHYLHGPDGFSSEPVVATDSGSRSSAPIESPSGPILPKGTVKVAAAATPTPKPKPKAGETPRPTQSPEASPTPTPHPTPSPTPVPTVKPKPALALDPEPKLPETKETVILKKRGWRHAGSGESVVKAVKLRPPVLLLAYDPHCPDCYALITKVLDTDVMNSLPVTRIAIQESMLSGQVDHMITSMPTLILFGPDGTRLMDHVGSRITPEELAKEVRAGLAKLKK